MDRQDVFAYVKAQYGIEPDYPWNDSNAVLRHKNSGKWFGVMLSVSADKLGMDDTGPVDVLNVKCEPMLIDSLQMKEGYFPAYHMNKIHWISILLGENDLEKEIKNLIGLSFEMTQGHKDQSTI